jgi:hypothetical protein
MPDANLRTPTAIAPSAAAADSPAGPKQRGNEPATDESTVRRKVAVVWRELTRAGP